MFPQVRITKVSLFLTAVLLATLTLSELSTFASCASAPLNPIIEVVPNRVSLQENITLRVKITVEEVSNVSSSPPLISGVGDASLLFERASIIVEPGEVGTLEWVYNATKLGAISFGLEISVKKLSDESVVRSQSLSSAEIGISRGSEIFLLGLAILAVYILLSSRFEWFKPKESLYALWGGWVGILYSLGFLVLGWLFATVGFTMGVDSVLTIGISGAVFSGYGLYCCQIHKHLAERIHPPSKIRLTELTGLGIVLFGLSGFFVAWKSWFELVLLITLGIVATAKEFIEMETEK